MVKLKNKIMYQSIFVKLGLIAVFFLFFNCSAQERKHFSIRADIQGLQDNIWVYLTKYRNAEKIGSDTVGKVKTKDGKFAFKGIIPNGAQFFFITFDKSSKLEYKTLFLDNSVRIKGSIANWPEIVITGSRSHSDFTEFVKLDKSARQIVKEKEKDYFIAIDQRSIAVHEGKRDTIVLDNNIAKAKTNLDNANQERYKIWRDFINDHPDSYYTARLVIGFASVLGAEGMKDAYEKLTPKVKQSFEGQNLYNLIVYKEKAESIGLGKRAPDFTSKTPDGRSLSLTDLLNKGEYILIDFWASWCKPCREEYKNVKKVFDQFGGKGFTVLSVSVDFNEKDWKDAIYEDKLNWYHVSDLKGAKGGASTSYGVVKYPTNFLVNDQGIIVAIDLFEDSLQNKIRELLQNKPDNSASIKINKIYDQYKWTLDIKDQMPDFTLTNVFNYPKSIIKISEFKNKSLILYFWNKSCAVGKEFFIEMNQWQERFADELQILMILSDNFSSELNTLFQSRPFKNLVIPIIIGDTLLNKLFPHRGNPYIVWLNRDRIVNATTYYHSLNLENIEKFVLNDQINLPIRKDLMDFDVNASLLKEGGGRMVNDLKYYSVIRGYIKGAAFATSYKTILDKEGKIISIRVINHPIVDMYKIAYDFASGKIIFNPNDTGNYFRPTNINEIDLWEQANLYCYEAKLSGLKNIKKIMQQDLDRYFGIESKVEIRKVNCIVLYRLTQKDKLQTKGGEKIIENRMDSVIYKNTSFILVVNHIKKYYSGKNDMPVLDETGYKNNIDIIIKAKDIINLRRELELYGIGMKEEAKSVKCLVLNKT